MPTFLSIVSEQLGVMSPWLAGVLLVVSVIGWSPFGRGLLLRMKTPPRDDGAMRDLIVEVLTLRQDLADVHERLYWAERGLLARTPGKTRDSRYLQASHPGM